MQCSIPDKDHPYAAGSGCGGKYFDNKCYLHHVQRLVSGIMLQGLLSHIAS